MDEWREVCDFPGYSVSEYGFVRNDHTSRIMRTGVNNRGMVTVGLVRKGEQIRKSVAVLVAEAFIIRPRREWNRLINLDGDRSNVAASNLMWRPLWFAQSYHSQFRGVASFTTPIVEIGSGEEFEDSWDAAIKYGLLDRDIYLSAYHRTYVFPTYQRFRLIRK
jgi:hypothetical protein